MPHSSGGGSHSGGSHSGSGFSSSSSSSGGSSAKHIKNTSFPGARRYVYYENYRPVYIYADYDIRKGTASGKFFSILGSAVSLLFGIMLLAMCYDKPQKMDTSPSYSCEIVDCAGVIDDADMVQSAIDDFYDETGISPAVITVENSDWQGVYSDLENYAYDLYVNHFADESHWLIVYSTPDGYSSSDGFEDWYWEGMQGNDTDDVLTKSVTNSFNDELQKNLTARTRYTVSSAISTSFDDLTPTVMKSKVNWTMLFTSIAILAFVCLHACLMIGINPKARKYAKAKPCSDAAQEKACEYCGYTYVVDTCTECPHCGAPIPPEDQPGHDLLDKKVTA